MMMDNIRTKEDIIEDMLDEIPFGLSNQVRPYIYEAMEIYAKQQVKLFSIPVVSKELPAKCQDPFESFGGCSFENKCEKCRK